MGWMASVASLVSPMRTIRATDGIMPRPLSSGRLTNR
jgi:hypothetical protein